jgi:hypothetical protein
LTNEAFLDNEINERVSIKKTVFTPAFVSTAQRFSSTTGNQQSPDIRRGAFSILLTWQGMEKRYGNRNRHETGKLDTAK